MKTRFLLPVLAAIFAIGMSFTTEDKTSDPTQDYIIKNGVYEPLGQELNCEPGFEDCRVELRDGSVHLVFDAPNAPSPKEGSGKIIKMN